IVIGLFIFALMVQGRNFSGWAGAMALGVFDVFEHHVAMVRGNHAEIVHEAVFRYLGWPIYHHQGTPEPMLATARRR
ncbi:hypothetical protein J8J27_28930, partial [Mycobacterium tuberculosis]|nr:hypothetical protein [Mycobacterium tuberculosis]